MMSVMCACANTSASTTETAMGTSCSVCSLFCAMTMTSSRMFSVCANAEENVKADNSIAKDLVKFFMYMPNPSVFTVTMPNSPHSAEIVLQRHAITQICVVLRARRTGKRLQSFELLRKFTTTMNILAANGFSHLRRPRTQKSGWVAL